MENILRVVLAASPELETEEDRFQVINDARGASLTCGHLGGVGVVVVVVVVVVVITFFSMFEGSGAEEL